MVGDINGSEVHVPLFLRVEIVEHRVVRRIEDDVGLKSGGLGDQLQLQLALLRCRLALLLHDLLQASKVLPEHHGTTGK